MNEKRLMLDTDEVVLFKVRKHWFILAVEVLGVAFFALIPPVLYTTVVDMGLEAAHITYSFTGFFIAFYSVWLIIMWMVLFSVWTNYYLDMWTLTNKRLVAVDQKGLFHRTTASFRLERLQDVIISINGIIPTFLKFGTVEIQTAGEERNFKVSGLPHPEEIKAAILEASGNASVPKDQNATGGM
jgi:hypothetical protein